MERKAWQQHIFQSVFALMISLLIESYCVSYRVAAFKQNVATPYSL